jgi:hypothetical protein
VAEQYFEGYEQLNRALAQLGSTVAKRVVKSATNAGLTVTSKAIKAAISAEPGLSPGLRRSLKKLVGKRFRKSKQSDNVVAKAGFAVGSAQKKQIGRSGKNRGGVGLSAQNVHWFALGTKTRRTGSGVVARLLGRGASRGRITEVKVVANAYQVSKGAAVAAMKKKSLERIEAEVKKLRSRR